MFIQHIEGPKDEIEQLYKNILKDSRHQQVVTLKSGTINDRFFPGWSMAVDLYEDNFDPQGAIDLCAPESLKVLELLERP